MPIYKAIVLLIILSLIGFGTWWYWQEEEPSNEKTQEVDYRASLLQSCQAALSKTLPEWRLVNTQTSNPITGELHPQILYGDFDGDGIEDVALMIQAITNPKSKKIAECLSSLDSGNPMIIDNPYCWDGILLAPKGQEYFDFDTEDGIGIYPLDGVHAYCEEVAGATYIYQNGTFKLIVDSD